MPGTLENARFPFSAIVGMDDMRLALVLNAIDPAIGGVLVRGEKGTAKSTAVRALASVLPDIDVVVGCRYACDPQRPDPQCPDGPHQEPAPWLHRPVRLRELPVGATEDRLVGSLNLERALTEGVSTFEPGLLADANRGVLYVDEVNLLHDHLVDLLLDAAAMGISYVEREGVSVRHAARFLLVGTMNPEEGELRPQLLDRFGLTVEVAAPRDAPLRAEVVRRRLRFDADPAAFAECYAAAEAQIADEITAAREALTEVRLDDVALARIAYVCAAFEVDGLRADIVTARTALAHAAWAGRSEVSIDDIRAAARLALPHRRRRNPFDAPGLDEQELEQILHEAMETEPEPDPSGSDPSGSGVDQPHSEQPESQSLTDSTPRPGSDPVPESEAVTAHDSGPTQEAGSPNASLPEAGALPMPACAPEQIVAPAAAFRTRRIEVPGIGSGTPGRRSRAVTDVGQLTGALPPTTAAVRQLHVMATLTAAAPHQLSRGHHGPGLRLHRSDLRSARREAKEGNLVLFVVDSSGSMAAQRRMAAVKAAVMSLLLDAYQRRDKVGMITFRGEGAELTLPPTSSVDTAAARLTVLPSGGRTPLAEGLLLAHRTLGRERLRDPKRRPLLVLITDGRHSRGADPAQAAQLLARSAVNCVVVDCESGRVRLGLASGLARQLGAPRYTLDELAVGDALAHTVRSLKRAS